MDKKLIDLIKNNSIRNFLTYFVFDALNKAFPFLLLVIITNYLTTEEFGLISNFLVCYQIALVLVSYNTYTKLSTDFYEWQHNIGQLFGNLSFSSIILGLLFFGVIYLFGGFFERYVQIDRTWQYIALLCAFASSMIQLYTSLLRMEGNAFSFGILQNLQSGLLFLLCIILVVFIPLHWQGRIYAQLGGSIFTFFVVLFFILKRKLFVFTGFKKNFLKLLMWGLPLLPHSLSYWLKYGFDKIIVTNFQGLSVNGVYSLALSLSGILVLVSSSFFSVYSPYVYKKLYEYDHSDSQEEKNGIISHLLRNARLYVGGYAVISVIAYALLVIVISYLNPDYHDAIIYLPWLLAAGVINGIYNVYSSFLFYRQRTKIIGAITFSSSVFQTILSYALIQYIGIYGVLWATVFTSVYISLFCTYFSFKEYHINALRF